MNTKNPYEIIKSRHVTEKAMMLQSLKDMESNPSVRKCQSPKYVFKVHPKANKQEIASAIEEIYKSQDIKVVSVNTVTIKPKTRRVRGRLGKRAGLKKAIVTLEPNDNIDNV